MADITIHQACSSFDNQTRRCVHSGLSCPFANAQFRSCPDCSFIARIAMPPDEFQILVDAEHRPTVGTLPLRRCRKMEIHRQVAGVHVNSVLQEDGRSPLLEARWHGDRRVQYSLKDEEEIGLVWDEGHFLPL